ncbi:MAG: hypothetical protein U5N58_00935 [Actinomycetota bacterium]|nr:hypothetical protein [Actinomycetota bacterium]
MKLLDRLKLKEQRMNRIMEDQPIPLFYNILEEEYGNQDIIAIIKNYVGRHQKKLKTW